MLKLNFGKKENVFILEVVKNGYKLPFGYVPQKVYLKSNKSTRENDCFVKSEIKSEVTERPYVINPLNVAYNKVGKTM
jgi:hypothetical protein